MMGFFILLIYLYGMKDKLKRYLDYVLNELLRETQYGFFEGYGEKYVMVLTPELVQSMEEEGFIYSKSEVMKWTHTVGTGGVWDYKYVENVYGLNWLEAQEVIEKYVRILAKKILNEWK